VLLIAAAANIVAALRSGLRRLSPTASHRDADLDANGTEPRQPSVLPSHSNVRERIT